MPRMITTPEDLSNQAVQIASQPERRSVETSSVPPPPLQVQALQPGQIPPEQPSLPSGRVQPAPVPIAFVFGSGPVDGRGRPPEGY